MHFDGRRGKAELPRDVLVVFAFEHHAKHFGFARGKAIVLCIACKTGVNECSYTALSFGGGALRNESKAAYSRKRQ